MMMVQESRSGTAGQPLAVCVNDCPIDLGQPAAELRRICFSLGCAFAEMRWGKEVRAASSSD